jgi:hypothetical protein
MKIGDKMKGFLDGVNAGMGKADKMVDKIMNKIEFRINKVKKKMLSGLLQIGFVLVGMLLLILGLILFLTRFFNLDLILIVAGLALLYVAVMLSWMK